MKKNILIINSGSSSIKIHVFNFESLEETKTLNYEYTPSPKTKFKTHLEKAYKKLHLKEENFLFVAHRVVHGGKKYSQPVLITKQVEKDIQDLSKIAPLHNPINLESIKFFKSIFEIPHFAVFDTSFFHQLPKVTQVYPIPIQYYLEDEIQKYGFHGISHKYIYQSVLENSNKKNLSGITCHLGNGVSLTAHHQGTPIETTMGFTPTSGCMMGTRSGDIDPGILAYLKSKNKKLDLEDLINKQSGLFGLTGTHHMKEIHDLAMNNHQTAKLAIEIYCYSIAKHLASLYGLIPKVDFIAFSGGIGFNAPYIRQAIYEYLPGLELPKPTIIQTNEALQIAKETKQAYMQ